MTLLEALARALPAGALETDPDILEGYRRDQTPILEAGTPAALVRARSAADVQATIRVAAEHRAPVVARGAGSGLAGGANAIDGCVVLSLERMTSIVEIDPANLIAVAEPGVVTGDLDRAARAHGLWYPPDPASRDFSTIGGNIATNAGGLCCVKYGVTREYVLGLEVVLADGTVARLGGRTRKDVAGLDLVRLFTGSEGTLGILTQATLRLRPAPPPARTLVASFDALASAGDAISAIVSRRMPSLLELMDQTTIRAVEALKPVGLDPDARALLIAQSDAADGGEELAGMEALCREAGATFTLRSEDAAEAELLLEARRMAFFALERLGPSIPDDVAVPPAAIPALLRRIEAIAAETGLVIGTFGHAGDGNMHPRIGYDEATVEIAWRAFDGILRAALELGGTVTGEHGVGVLKRAYVSEDARRLHGAIKGALDPLGILNPGKAL